MTIFTSDQIEALRHLARLWSPERFAIVKAAALACFMDMRWRKTDDLDLAVAVSVGISPSGSAHCPAGRLILGSNTAGSHLATFGWMSFPPTARHYEEGS